jgi:hypothetical protein
LPLNFDKVNINAHLDVDVMYLIYYICTSKCALMNKKSKIIQRTFTVNDVGRISYLLLIFLEGEKVVGTAAIRLYSNFHLHDEISHYQFYAFSSN